MNCEECIYQFKCYTVVKQPRKIAGVRFELAYSCSECMFSRPWGERQYKVCPKTTMLVHKKSLACSNIELSKIKNYSKIRISDTLENAANATYDKRPVYCFDSEDRKIKKGD